MTEQGQTMSVISQEVVEVLCNPKPRKYPKI